MGILFCHYIHRSDEHKSEPFQSLAKEYFGFFQILYKTNNYISCYKEIIKAKLDNYVNK